MMACNILVDIKPDKAPRLIDLKTSKARLFDLRKQLRNQYVGRKDPVSSEKKPKGVVVNDELIPIEKDIETSITDGTVKESIKLVLEYYNVIGFEKQWISYMIVLHDKYVGMCSFKGMPINNNVEIAYYTFANYEGKGLATQACKQLIHIARKQAASVIISARTLPEKNASTHILEKIGFKNTGTVMDIEDGNVFEWIYQG